MVLCYPRQVDFESLCSGGNICKSCLFSHFYIASISNKQSCDSKQKRTVVNLYSKFEFEFPNKVKVNNLMIFLESIVIEFVCFSRAIYIQGIHTVPTRRGIHAECVH